MIHLRAFKVFFFSFLFFFSFHSQPTISGGAHGGRRFGKTLVIGLCIVKSDRLSDSHTNHGGEIGGRGFGGWDAVSLSPYSRTRHLLSFFCFPLALTCLALPLRIIMVTLDWLGARIRIRCMHYTYMLCMHVWGPPSTPQEVKTRKYKRWIIEQENTSFLLPRK